MDIQQLKLLAGHIRGLLQRTNHAIGHNQSLDLVAALPGLRNWPEVVAFPDRVANCELDQSSAGRLAFRLKKCFGLDISSHALLTTLSESGVGVMSLVPRLWPSGPTSGVYVTTSQAGINALLERYEEATDGAIVYAERAGNHWEGAIDLGEYGLWSSGLDRVPSGTLLVVGPLPLDQQSWRSTTEHLEMACLHVLNSGHRVAVLLDTPTPETLCEDVRLMVMSGEQGRDDVAALRGVVTDEGNLEVKIPFAQPWPGLQQGKAAATSAGMPEPLLKLLRDALQTRGRGLLLFGSATIKEFAAIDLIIASLAMTERFGPAARIMPRHRSTPSKDFDVPEGIRQLPYLPSIESAYAQGYRRIIYHPNYTQAKTLMQYSEDALLISETFGTTDVMEVFMSSFRAGEIAAEKELLSRIIAIAAIIQVPTKRGDISISDLYVTARQPLDQLDRLEKFEDIERFLLENRSLRWEDEMSRFLDSEVIAPAVLKKVFPRNRHVNEYLTQRGSRKPFVESA